MRYRSEITQENPDAAPKEIMSLIGASWKNASAATKNLFTREAEEDKQRYQTEQQEYEDSDAKAAWEASGGAITTTVSKEKAAASRKSKKSKASKVGKSTTKKSKAGKTSKKGKASKVGKSTTKKSKEKAAASRKSKKSKASKSATLLLFSDRKQLAAGLKDRSLQYRYYMADPEERARLELIAQPMKRPNVMKVFNEIKVLTDDSRLMLENAYTTFGTEPEYNERLWEEVEAIPKRSRNLRIAMFKDLYLATNIYQRVYLIDSYRLFNPSMETSIQAWLVETKLIEELEAIAE